METRDVIDNEGNLIGVLTLPNNTSEDTWASMLEAYKAFLMSFRVVDNG